MTKLVASLIAAPVKASTVKEVYAPYDLTLIARVESCDQDGVEQALATAYSLFKQRDHWLPLSRRIEILQKTAELMSQQVEQLALDAAREGGKPLVDSRVEVIRAIDSIRLCVEHIRTHQGSTIAMNLNAASQGKQAYTLPEPIGVVVAISAFNHPLNLIAHQVGPAIAAGCPVIVKPAEDTPLSCFKLVALLREAGLPDEWCQALLVDNRDIAAKLVSDPRVAFLSFIGSAKVGWMLRSKLAAGTRCALEHGGVAPVILTEDADQELALTKVLKGGFYHAGQVCVSVQRVFVPRYQARTFAEKLAEAAQKLIIGDPCDAVTEVGPLIRPAETNRVKQWVDEAINEGAECLCGGEVLSASTYAATVLYNPSIDSKVSRQEVFGPVVCVYSYDALDQAIEQANALPWAFQAAVFSENRKQFNRIANKLDASAVMQNDHTAFRVDWMPFAGLRQSGLGVGGIPYTIEDMQIQKMRVLDDKESVC